MNDSGQAGRALEILVGLVAGVIGGGLLSLALLLAYKGIERGDTANPILLVGLPIAAVIGGFFALISYRLVLNRGAKVSGGLLSPIGWKVIGVIFVGIAVILTIAAIRQEQWAILSAPISAIVFAKWCFRAPRAPSAKPATNSSTV